jgi:hypothetical protein
MSTRDYQFIVGPETSTLPTATDPVASGDIVNLGYADKTYTHGVADVAAVKAVAAASRTDNMSLWVDSLKAFFYFDSGSSATGDDVQVITPTAGTGRWLKAHAAIPTAGLTASRIPSTDASGNLQSSGNATFSGDMTVTGDLTVQGTTTTLQTTNLDVEDTNITINDGGNDATSEGAGLTVERTGTAGSLKYATALTSKFKIGDLGSESEIITAAGAQSITGVKTITNPVLTAPDLNAGTVDSLSSLSVRDTSAAFDVTIAATSSPILTAGRTLTVDVNDANRTLDLAGNLTLAANLSTSGAFAQTLTATALTNVTLPTTGTLSTLAGVENLSGKTFTDAVTMAQIATPSTPAASYNKIYPKSDGNFYNLNSSGVEQQIGGGGGGGSKNYFSTVNNSNGNGNFELGATTGFNKLTVSLSSLIPTGAPTIGTAASVTTFAVNSTTPLAGTYDLQMAGSSGFTAGQGWISDARTIDQADQAKVQTIKIYYKAVTNGTGYNFSGTSANTYAVYIYDTVNSAWIQPAGVYGMTQSSGVGYMTGTFQTPSNMTSFRIAVIAINATSSNTEIRFDDISVGPQTAPIGAVVTDTKDISSSVTPTGFGTVTNKSIWMQQIGDRYYIQGKFTAGTATGVNASIDFSGFAMDSAKMSSSSVGQSVGDVERVGTSISDLTLFYDGSTTTSIFFSDNASSAGSFSKRLGTSVSNNNDTWSFSIDFPVSGKSSNVQMSNDTDTRVVAARLTGASGSQTFGSLTVVTFTTVEKDTHGATSSFQRFTAPISGYYNFDARITAPTASATATAQGFYAALYKNGTGGTQLDYCAYTIQATGINNFITLNPRANDVFLNAGDYVEVYIEKDTNSSAAAVATSAHRMHFSAERVSGPSVIAASETILARYTTATAGSYTAGTIVDFGTKVEDSHGNLVTTGAAWKFTANAPGRYFVAAKVRQAAAAAGAAGENYALVMSKNGADYCVLGEAISQNTTSLVWPLGGSDEIYLLAGDYIQFYMAGYTGTRTLTTNALYNHVYIARVGL